ncbi:MAG: hypothetical protein AB7L41_09175 [Flavobacteriaceae bacterium]
MAPRLLVTGFGPFPGAPANPTADLVAGLRVGTHGGIEVRAETLAVEYALLDHWHDVLDLLRPDAILHFGLAGGARGIRVETRAMNNALPYRADDAGRLPRRLIDPAGPAMRRASLPAEAIRDAVAATGARVRLSIDAGDYLCNAILYSSLAWCARHRGARAGFVHVPASDAATLRPGFEAAVGAVAATLSRAAASSG